MDRWREDCNPLNPFSFEKRSASGRIKFQRTAFFVVVVTGADSNKLKLV